MTKLSKDGVAHVENMVEGHVTSDQAPGEEDRQIALAAYVAIVLQGYGQSDHLAKSSLLVGYDFPVHGISPEAAHAVHNSDIYRCVTGAGSQLRVYSSVMECRCVRDGYAQRENV